MFFNKKIVAHHKLPRGEVNGFTNISKKRGIALTCVSKRAIEVECIDVNIANDLSLVRQVWVFAFTPRDGRHPSAARYRAYGLLKHVINKLAFGDMHLFE
jgi:hypothetical protein